MRDILKTNRLVLRSVAIADAPLFSQYANDWDIAKMTGSIPHPFPLVSTEVKILTMMSQKRRGLAHPYVITLDGDALIGIMDIFRRSEDAEYELGYWVARPYWGKGYAVEAAHAIMEEAHTTLGVTTFIAGVFVDNPASMRVLEKLGFKNTGSEGDYFSMARLKHMESIGFKFDLAGISTADLQASAQRAIEAS